MVSAGQVVRAVAARGESERVDGAAGVDDNLLELAVLNLAVGLPAGAGVVVAAVRRVVAAEVKDALRQLQDIAAVELHAARLVIVEMAVELVIKGLADIGRLEHVFAADVLVEGDPGSVADAGVVAVDGGAEAGQSEEGCDLDHALIGKHLLGRKTAMKRPTCLCWKGTSS